MIPFQLIIDPYSIKIEVFEGDSLLDPIQKLMYHVVVLEHVESVWFKICPQRAL